MPHHLTIKDHIREQDLFTQRLLILGIIVLCFSVFLLARLVYLQVNERAHYRILSHQNQVSLLPIEPNRGLIYDRNGVLIAENIPVFSLEIIPNRVADLPKTLDALKKIVALDEADLEQFQKSLQQKRAFDRVTVKLKLTDREVARFSVNRYQFPGVMVQAHLIRNYPLGPALAHVLGYVGRINESEIAHLDSSNYSATHFIGKVGIEKYYESLLHGTVGYQQVESDASGRVVRIIHRTHPISGNNLYLTIDSGLEITAEKALGKSKGAVVAIDPNNGEVLTIVSTPSYEPNLFVKGISQKAYKTLASSPDQPLYNRALRGQYPLASTIKPFEALKALDDKVVTPSYKIFDPGWFKLPSAVHLYRDWKPQGHGWINLTRALIVSCDTYFYNLADLMGIHRIDAILTSFGFGRPTGIDMGEELSGLVPGPDWKRAYKGAAWYTGDTIISGIGQGFMLTTPLQLADATAALAEKGRRYKPHLLLRQVNPDGTLESTLVTKKPRVTLAHESSWRIVIRAMKGVILNREGTGFRFGRDAHYSVAAKTGTAQVYSENNNDHFTAQNLPKNLRDHSLFIAFAPVKKPKIAVAVIVENNNSAAHVARKVMDYYLKHRVRK